MISTWDTDELNGYECSWRAANFSVVAIFISSQSGQERDSRNFVNFMYCGVSDGTLI